MGTIAYKCHIISNDIAEFQRVMFPLLCYYPKPELKFLARASLQF